MNVDLVTFYSAISFFGAGLCLFVASSIFVLKMLKVSRDENDRWRNTFYGVVEQAGVFVEECDESQQHHNMDETVKLNGQHNSEVLRNRKEEKNREDNSRGFTL